MNLYVQLEFSSQGSYLYFLLFFQNIESVHVKVKYVSFSAIYVNIKFHDRKRDLDRHIISVREKLNYSISV